MKETVLSQSLPVNNSTAVKAINTIVGISVK